VNAIDLQAHHGRQQQAQGILCGNGGVAVQLYLAADKAATKR
jgi:hypothetical protein